MRTLSGEHFQSKLNQRKHQRDMLLRLRTTKVPLPLLLLLLQQRESQRPRQNQAQRVTPKEMVQEDRSRRQRRIQKGRVKAMAEPELLQNQKQRQSLIPAYLVFFGQKELAIGGIHALSFMTPSTKPLQRKLLLLQTQRVARVHQVPPQQKPLLQLLSLRRCQVRLHRFRMLVQSAHGRLPSMMSPHRIPTCHLLVDLCRQLSSQSKPCSRSLLLLGH